MNATRILRILSIVLIVVIVGAFLGWYAFVKKQVGTTQAVDSERGFGIAPSFGSPLGSTNDIAGVSASGTSTPGAVAPRLWQVTRTPVAGFGFSASTSRLYLAERATGNILQADPADSSLTRLTNTLFPKTYAALFAKDGSVLLRSLNDAGAMTTFAGTITHASSTDSNPGTLTGLYLPENILSIAARSNPNQIFYLARSGSTVVGKTADWKGGAQKQVFSSILGQWQSAYLEDGAIYVMQNPSDGVAGYAFKLSGGAAVPVAGPISGLEILPRTSSGALLYSSSGSGGAGLYARASASSSAVTLPVRTIAEKCVWAPGNALVAYCAVPVSISSTTFLEDLLDGSLHTTDVWWRVDVSAGTANKFFTTDSSLSLDVRDPKMDDSGAYIAFRNATDDTLWMLRINQ
jgi:hypothetical protein